MASTSIVGLDIGSSAIRGIQVSKGKNGKPTIEKVGMVPLPYGVFINGIVEEDGKETLINSLKTLWKQAKFTTNQVNLGIGSSETLARVGRVDWAPDEDLSKILPYTDLVQTAIVDDVNSYYIDYHTLSEDVERVIDPTDPDETIMKRTKLVLVGGGSRESIDKLVDATRSAGLKPVAVDLTGLALIRSHNPNIVPDQIDTVDISVDLGAETTTLVIHKMGQPMYMRTVDSTGGQRMTQKIAKELKVPYEKAELRKFEALYSQDEVHDDGAEINARSVFDMEDESDMIDPNMTEEQYEEERKRKERKAKIQPIVSEGSSAIVNLVRDSVQHFIDGEAGGELGRISSFALSGGMALTPGLADRIASEFQTPTYPAMPLSSNMDEKQASKIPQEIMGTESSFSVAYGLAIGEGSTHD